MNERPLFRSTRPSRDFYFPGPDDRVSINGKTGSGKSTFAFWLFAESADFDRKPWVIVDNKAVPEEIPQKLLNEEDAKLIKVKDAPPRAPGIYVIRPKHSDASAFAAWLWKAHDRGNIGLIFDELYMVPDFKNEGSSGGGPLKAILTQGRSKHIPVYGLTQRPVDVNLFMFSEAEFISVFYLKRREDRQRILSYVPDDDPQVAKIFDNRRLPDRWSRWYDDTRDIAQILHPAPPPKDILDTIALRVHRMREKRAV